MSLLVISICWFLHSTAEMLTLFADLPFTSLSHSFSTQYVSYALYEPANVAEDDELWSGARVLAFLKESSSSDNSSIDSRDNDSISLSAPATKSDMSGPSAPADEGMLAMMRTYMCTCRDVSANYHLQ